MNGMEQSIESAPHEWHQQIRRPESSSRRRFMNIFLFFLLMAINGRNIAAHFVQNDEHIKVKCVSLMCKRYRRRRHHRLRSRSRWSHWPTFFGYYVAIYLWPISKNPCYVVPLCRCHNVVLCPFFLSQQSHHVPTGTTGRTKSRRINGRTFSLFHLFDGSINGFDLADGLSHSRCSLSEEWLQLIFSSFMHFQFPCCSIRIGMGQTSYVRWMI